MGQRPGAAPTRVVGEASGNGLEFSMKTEETVEGTVGGPSGNLRPGIKAGQERGPDGRIRPARFDERYPADAPFPWEKAIRWVAKHMGEPGAAEKASGLQAVLLREAAENPSKFLDRLQRLSPEVTHTSWSGTGPCPCCGRDEKWLNDATDHDDEWCDLVERALAEWETRSTDALPGQTS